MEAGDCSGNVTVRDIQGLGLVQKERGFWQPQPPDWNRYNFHATVLLVRAISVLKAKVGIIQEIIVK